MDILPHGIYSIHHFYDPDYSHLNLGTFSAIQEILLVKQFSKISPEFEYYYFGSYVHNHKKMNYKANFAPFELYCKSTDQWVSSEKALPLLEKNIIKFGEIKSEEKVSVKLIDQSKVIHFGITCDGCKKHEFTGVRYKCDQCQNFDFCQSCYEKRDGHFQGKHTFKSIFNDEFGDSPLVLYQDKISKLAVRKFRLILSKSNSLFH